MPFKFKPYSRREPDKKSVMMIKSKGRSEPASVVSSLINHLQDAWEKDLHLYAFVAHDSNLSIDSVLGAVLAKSGSGSD